MSSQLTVLNPTGVPPKVTGTPLAPRLETLDGATIFLIDCRFDDSGRFLAQVAAWFRERMPGVRAIVKELSSVYLLDDPATWREIQTEGNAAILGVGH